MVDLLLDISSCISISLPAPRGLGARARVGSGRGGVPSRRGHAAQGVPARPARPAVV